MMPTARRSALTVLIALLGTGLTGYYGDKWLNLPSYSEAEIAQSVELNLAMDLEHRGPHLQPDAEGRERLRTLIRTEVEADIRQERQTVETRLGVGLICLVLAFGQALAQRLTRP